MDIRGYTRKDIGNLGESVAAEYLRRQGFAVLGRNIARKWGELDIVARKEGCLHVIEVKSRVCSAFPGPSADSAYGPSNNLHSGKIRTVARMAAWYVSFIGWEGEWQIDGALVWLRAHDGMARVRYLPQLL